MARQRVVIAAGGTAGHVVPALAVADALRADGARGLVHRRARSRRGRARARRRATRSTCSTSAASTAPTPCARRARCASPPPRFPAARGLLRERGAEAVLGGGGYVAGPAGLAALSLGLPLVLTEADRHLGLTNRLLARRARRVCLAFPIEGRDGERYLVTGRPVPAAIADGRPRRGPRALRDRAPTTAACSSSAAARARARSTAPRSRRSPGRRLGRPRLPRPPHQRQPRLRRAGDRRRLAGGSEPDRYTLLEYEPDLADALAASDLVLARSGGSIFEIAAAGRPAILVPYPYAAARPPARERRVDGRRRGGGRDRRRRRSTRARCATPAAGLLGDPQRLERDGRRRRRGSPARTPRSGSPTSSSARSANLMADDRGRTGAGASCTSSRSAAPG